jgi:hypothetical protein
MESIGCTWMRRGTCYLIQSKACICWQIGQDSRLQAWYLIQQVRAVER